MDVHDEHVFSMGTAGSVRTILAMPKTHTSADTIMVNYATLLRNCMSNDKVKEAIDYDKLHRVDTEKPAKVLIGEFLSELPRLFETLGLKLAGDGGINPTIVGYHAAYAKIIPKEFYRVPPKSKRTLVLAESMLSASAIKSALGGVSGVVIRSFLYADKRPTRLHLDDVLGTINNRHRVLMLTNHFMDCHVAKSCETFTLVRSFTGAAVQYKDLGSVVFENTEVPFNTYTHALLGDKDDIKSNISSADFDKLVTAARLELWTAKTSEFVRERLEQLGFNVPFVL